MARNRRPERRRRTPPRRKEAPPGGRTTRSEVKESGRFPPSSMPQQAQTGQPVDYPNEQATFSTGPEQAVQYHYTRQDLYSEQFAQEQIQAEQASASQGAGAVPGPGQAGVSYG